MSVRRIQRDGLHGQPRAPPRKTRWHRQQTWHLRCHICLTASSRQQARLLPNFCIDSALSKSRLFDVTANRHGRLGTYTGEPL